MKKILVAIDIARGDGNEMVIKTAQGIAGAMGGEITLLHVIEPAPGHLAGEVPEGILGKRKIYVDEELDRLVADYGCADSAVREGPPSREILEYAEKIDADLIVLHSHDPDFTNYFLGSVASRVVRHAHCSVHVVRQADH